jgi:predicted transcriptional regulator
VTDKEELHQLIDGLSEEQASQLLDDLRDAADTGGAPLSAESLESLDRGIADIAAGRVVPLEEFERQNPC